MTSDEDQPAEDERSGRADEASHAAPEESTGEEPGEEPGEESGDEPGDRPDDPFTGPDWHPSPATAAHTGTGDSDAAGHGTGGHRRIKISRRRRRMMRRRRRIGWVLIGLGALVVLAGAWLVITGLMARSELNTARAEVHTLRSQITAGDLDAARHTARELGRHAGRAHSLTGGPAWAVAAALPGGGPIGTLRGITSGIDRLGRQVLPAVIDASDKLDPSTLRSADGSIDLAPIAEIAPTLTRASHVMDSVTSSVAGLPAHTWLSAADSARSDLLTQLRDLGKTLHSADLAAQTLPGMLGRHGTQRYFVAFQNEAEARGTGGLPGAFAIVSAADGKLSFEKFEADNTLFGVHTDLDFGAAYDQLYHGANTTTDYRNSNLSPNFPYAAQTWLAMWKKYSGQQLDGAIAVDPTALSYLLAVTGPAPLADGSQLTAANVVALTQSTVYSKFPGLSMKMINARKVYLLDVARAASEKVLDAHADTKALVKAAGRAAGERRLLVWSRNPTIEARLAQTSVGGVIPATTAPYVGLFIINDGGNKLDYYLHRSLSWQRRGCGATRDVTVTVTLTNDAPATGLSKYVTNRSDKHSYPVKPGDQRLEVNYLATDGAQLSSVTVNGTAATASAGVQTGHPQYTVDVELPRGTTRTVVLHLLEPGTAGPPIVLHQPLIHPLPVSLHDASCS